MWRHLESNQNYSYLFDAISNGNVGVPGEYNQFTRSQWLIIFSLWDRYPHIRGVLVSLVKGHRTSTWQNILGCFISLLPQIRVLLCPPTCLVIERIIYPIVLVCVPCIISHP